LTLNLGQALKEAKNRERLHSIDGIYALLGLLPYGDKVSTEEHYKGVSGYTKRGLHAALLDIIWTAKENGYYGDFFG